jgi:hypothetical protein
MKQPAVTVLLPAYNAEAWVGQAVESILRQSFRDFELLVIDDGSTDNTVALLNGYKDGRIRVVRHEANRGLIACLNEGLGLSRGALIARMDADDFAHERRLELQVAFLNTRPDVGICGTWFHLRQAKRRTRVRTPVTHAEIAARLFFRSAFGHPTVILRRAFLQQFSLRYDPQSTHAEDFDLWVRASGHTHLANVPRYLLDYRVHSAQASSQHLQPQSAAASRVRLRQLATLLPGATEDEKQLHLRACDGYVFVSKVELIGARSWFDHLGAANARVGMFPLPAFGDALAHAWTYCCHRAAIPPGELLPTYFSRRYSRFTIERLRERVAVTRAALSRYGKPH